MFTALNRRAVMYSILIGQNKRFSRISDQLAEIQLSGQKLVAKTYF